MINTERLCLGCMSDNGGEKICPVCGYDASSRNPADCLPTGFYLANRYLVGRAETRNGEGITYIGWDSAKNAAVTVREYFPTGFAARNPDKTAAMLRGGEYTFNEGLLEFMDVNRQIMASELPALIPVNDVFEENGTAYAVCERISSITMREFLKKNGGSLKWEQARPLFLPLIDTVKGMNDSGIIHGGISIDTVMVGRDGKLRIAGYAVKKLRLADSELEEELCPGFAAAEQYDSAQQPIGAYTDVYGLCAVLFTVLIGTVPPAAPVRLQNDSMSIPAKFAEELPRHVLSALANGLQVNPKNRTENIETFKNELVYAELSDTAPVKHSDEKTPEKPHKKSGGTAKYVVISSACTAVVFLAVVAILVFTVFRDNIFQKDINSGSSDDTSVSAPSMDVIGTYDSDAAVSTVLFSVPSLTGKYYSELADLEDYEKFKFVIKGEEYSDKFARGQICAQSLAQGTNVPRDTEIAVTISLGQKEIKIANVLGLDETAAKLELLKQGFLYDNIEVLEKYDEEREPGTVLEQEPKYGTQVSPHTAVKIYINSYTGNTDSSDSGSSDR